MIVVGPSSWLRPFAHTRRSRRLYENPLIAPNRLCCFRSSRRLQTIEPIATIAAIIWVPALEYHYVSYDHRSSERNLSNCEQKPEKVRTSTGFEPVTSRNRLERRTGVARSRVVFWSPPSKDSHLTCHWYKKLNFCLLSNKRLKVPFACDFLENDDDLRKRVLHDIIIIIIIIAYHFLTSVVAAIAVKVLVSCF